MQKVFIYKLGKVTFRVNFWLLLLFLLMQTLLNELGFWQLDRAKEKQQIIIAIEADDNRIDSLDNVRTADQAKYAHFSGVLEFDSRSMLYIENQIHLGKVGYHILQLAREPNSKQWFWVNRGWHITVANRDKLPKVAALSGKKKIEARIYPIADRSVASESQILERMDNGYRLAALDKIALKKLEQQFSVKMMPWQLRLTSSEADLSTDWQWLAMPPEKHLAYAVQWFALALALLIVSLIAASRKKQD